MGRPKKDANLEGGEGLLNPDSAQEGVEPNPGTELEEEAEPGTGSAGDGSEQGGENPQQGAGTPETSAPEGGGQEGGTGSAGDGEGENTLPMPDPLPKDGTLSPPDPPKDGKRRVRHPCGEAKKVIAGETVVEFDAEGIAELEDEAAEYLLGIPGYKEVEENA